MNISAAKTIHLPWHQSDEYWVCVLPRVGSLPPALLAQLSRLGMEEVQEGSANAFRGLAPRAWGSHWQALYKALVDCNAEGEVDVAVVPGDPLPDVAHMAIAGRPASEMQAVAESLWLGDALLGDQLVCYFQPVLDAHGKTFGYESLMRARLPDGKVIGGGAIVAASKALSLQYAVDRHMQVQAVKTFVQSGLSGLLFINFIPGFIQRPEVYLEGLTEAVRTYGVVPRQIVLDITNSESPHDAQHIKRVADYCRSKGYAIALDDVESVGTAQNLLEAIRPEFVKMDQSLVHRVTENTGRETVRQIVAACRKRGATVLAEGVETQAMVDALKALEVDLFQGYFFSPPVPVEELAGK